MDFDFAQAKAAIRREVHTYFGVAAFYQDASLIAPQPIQARYHFKKMDRYGDIVETGYAEVTENIEKIALFPSDTPALTFIRGGRVTLPSMPGIEFILSAREPGTNTLEDVWQVVRA